MSKQQSKFKKLARNQFGYVLFILLAALFASTSAGTVNFGVYVLIYGIAAVGLMLLMGLAGQVSLGHAGFFAIGAYTQAILTTDLGVHWAIAAVPSVIVAMLAALLLGMPLLRLRGYYLALATLGLGIIVGVVANESKFTGGPSGIFGINKPEIGGFVFRSPHEFFWLLVPVVLLSVIIARNIVKSRVGRALHAIKDSEVAAETLGVDAFRLRLVIFVIAAGFAALAGVFYAHWTAVVSPEASSFQFSIMFLLMVILGGIGSVWGAVVGAFGAVFLEEAMRQFLPLVVPGASGEIQMLGFGFVLILLLMTLPGGLHQLAQGIWARINQRRRAEREQPESTAAVVDEAIVRLQRSELLGPASDTKRGEVVISVQGLTKRFNGIVAVEDVSFDVRAGEILALIGPNGAGKTTCFNMMSGVVTPSDGDVSMRGESLIGRKPNAIARLGATRTFQNLQVFGTASVLDNVKVGRHLRSARGFIAAALRWPALNEELQIERTANELVAGLGLTEVRDRPVAELSFGTQRLTEIARALAMQPSLLMLDEPMAGLSPQERNALADLLTVVRDSGIAILLVEHDVEQVMALANRVVVLDKGRLIANGTPEEVSSDEKVISAYLGVDEEVVESIKESRGGDSA